MTEFRGTIASAEKNLMDALELIDQGVKRLDALSAKASESEATDSMAAQSFKEDFAQLQDLAGNGLLEIRNSIKTFGEECDEKLRAEKVEGDAGVTRLNEEVESNLLPELKSVGDVLKKNVTEYESMLT